MKVPSIYDLAKSAQTDLKLKEERLKELEKEPLNSYIIHSLQMEIYDLKVVLSRFKIKLRNEKINELGL
jgi:hypothetical protein